MPASGVRGSANPHRSSMRFAYIDSNGNEVPIPSVDALALRIELGAISDETQLYDASADVWGPAHTHEIYTTLLRSSGEDGGFVAPPPVASVPVVPSPTDAAGGGTGPDSETPAEDASVEIETTEALAADEDAGVDEGDISGLTLAEPEPERAPEPPAENDLGLTLADSMKGDPPPAVSDTAEVDSGLTRTGDDDDLGALDLAPPLDASDDEPMPEDLAESELLEDGEAPAFDFGGMGDSMELEGPDLMEDDGAALDFTPDGFDSGAAVPGANMDFGADVDPSPDFSGGMELESSMEFEVSDFHADASGGLDLEAPMTEFTPDDPPSWMDGGDGLGEDVMDFSSISADAEAGDPLPGAPERRAPKHRPSPPKHRRRRRNLTLPLVAIVFFVAVGVGGYSAWPIVSARLAERATPEDTAVRIPALSEELMPVMQSAADAAMASSFRSVVAEWSAGARASAPGTDWPGGSYMANASQYEVVEQFWAGMSELLGLARGISLADFDGALAAELAARGVDGEDAQAIRERADSGFVAAAPARQELWNEFAALVDASLALHQFVLANEAGIEHVPASSTTTNPVLEIDAATPEIGAALDGMLGAVVDALSDLGYRNVVSSEGLRSHLLESLQARGVE